MERRPTSGRRRRLGRFLREDWCSAVRHDRFQGLHDALAKMIREDEFGRDLIAQLVAGGRGPRRGGGRQLRGKAVGVGGNSLPEDAEIAGGAVLGLRKNRGAAAAFSWQRSGRRRPSSGGVR